tara:strand:+ start:639 stop:1007 length:369 start_codon:yes stop_codon:yes gene_type:complete
MKYLPAIRAIRVVQIGLAILLSAALNFSNAKSDAHVFEASEAVFEKVVFATDTGDLGLAIQDQRFSENSEASQGFGDCHIHIIGLKQAQLACDQSSADRSRYWADASVVLAALQGFYRPPRG